MTHEDCYIEMDVSKLLGDESPLQPKNQMNEEKTSITYDSGWIDMSRKNLKVSIINIFMDFVIL
jgi:hypothetical protein